MHGSIVEFATNVSVWLDARDLWAALAIVAIWLAVLFTAVFGPDFVSTSAGGNSTVIPSGLGE